MPNGQALSPHGATSPLPCADMGAGREGWLPPFAVSRAYTRAFGFTGAGAFHIEVIRK